MYIVTNIHQLLLTNTYAVRASRCRWQTGEITASEKSKPYKSAVAALCCSSVAALLQAGAITASEKSKPYNLALDGRLKSESWGGQS